MCSGFYRKAEAGGFILVSTLSVLSLLLLLTLGMLSLSTTISRQSKHRYHQAIARANAQMALEQAIAKLQLTLGKDQAVCAEASLFETHDDPQSSADESTYVPNRHWLGAWNNTVRVGSINYPVVGKKADLGGTEPYRYKAIYSDLRHTEPHLTGGAWRNGLRQTWLVSRGGEVDHLKKLSVSTGAVEILGKGTLGHGVDSFIYEREKVLVPVIDLKEKGQKTGGYAYWITNNNLKARLTQSSANKESNESYVVREANPEGLKNQMGNQIMAGFKDADRVSAEKGLSFKSLELVGESLTVAKKEKFQAFVKQGFHDFTHLAYGLHTNVQEGGFKRDLTPVLFAEKNKRTVTYASTGSDVADFPFVSSNPIIPGERRAVMGPSFDALRHWGLSKYRAGLLERELEAETSFASEAGYRGRPTAGWARGMSDGVAFESSNWASEAPKFHPVMTEARYHYYLSYSGDSAKGNSNIRTHIMPRVCLWNPYSVAMKIPKMVVLMPNPFTENSGDIEIELDPDEAARLKKKYQTTGTTFDPVTGSLTNRDIYASWRKNSIKIRGQLSNGNEGYMPDCRFLGFTLESSVLRAGQCLVFSPKVNSPTFSQDGIAIQPYEKNDVSRNLLSARESQATHHFYHDYAIGKCRIDYEYFKPQKNRVRGTSWTSEEFFRDVDFSKAHSYQLWIQTSENWLFALKAANGRLDVSVDSMAHVTATEYPTLQVINNGNGGSNSSKFWYYSWFFGTSESASNGSFGHLQKFTDAPYKSPPRLHHVGTKMTYLDESGYEANQPLLRVGKWKPTNVAYHYPIIAHGNVRPHVVTRSASSQAGSDWYTNVHGSWLQSFNPSAVDDLADTPEVATDGYFSKNPMGAASQFDSDVRVAMFDLPDADYGALSLGNLRHASLSPYSWHPTYVIGSSVADLSSPSETSANLKLENVYADTDSQIKSSFTYWNGGIEPYTLSWGPETMVPDNQSLLQLGGLKTSKRVDGHLLNSEDEILTYDLSFEVNQNLWDRYFLSGMPLTDSSQKFQWTTKTPLYNRAYSFNHFIKMNAENVNANLGKGEGTADGFWNNGYYLKNDMAFNVNSTSVNAWISYLSGLRNRKRKSEAGSVGGKNQHVFTRLAYPLGANKTEKLDPFTQSAFNGGRILSDDEISLLANCIVREVKRRGPFLSLSDFVNRRLTNATDETSKMGAIEAAIVKSELNKKIAISKYTSSTDDGSTNNHIDWRPDYKRQVQSKIWGAPSYLIQSDLLAPLAPLLSVRGDTFTIRSYGESCNGGKIMAKAYLEATVIRSPEYVDSGENDHASVANETNRATEPAIKIQTATAVITQSRLTPTNARMGRRFITISKHWLNPTQI